MNKIRLFLFLSIQLLWLILCSTIFISTNWMIEFDLINNSCDYIIEETLVQICTNYKKNVFFGNLCSQLCDNDSDNQIKFIGCPCSASHIGKDVVIFAKKLPNISLVIKSKVLVEEKLTEISSVELSDYYRGIQQDIIGLSNVSLEQDLLPVDLLNDTDKITNHFLLIKQHEYVLSKLFENDLLYPKVLYTCGHFYATPKLTNIIHWTYLVSFPFQTSRDKIIAAIDLLKFLKRFINTKVPMELCDVKYYHFGYYENQTMLLLDSDLIQSRHTLKNTIEHVIDCDMDDDCHFIDCHGKCHQGSCRLDMTDNNLKRICRNILFMGKLYSLLNMGLLTMPWSSSSKHVEISMQRLYQLCFDADHQNLNNIVTKMEKILLDLLMYE